MPVYEITAPTGQTFEITAPEGATQEQVLAYAKQQFANQKPQDQSFTEEALHGGTAYLKQSLRGIYGMFDKDTANQAAIAGNRESQAYAAAHPDSITRIQQANQRGGLGAAALETAKQVPHAVAENVAPLVAQHGLGVAGGTVGTLFGGPVGGAIGTAAGEFASLYPSVAAQNMQVQAAEQQARGEDVDVNRVSAYGAAVPQTAVLAAARAFALGKNLVKNFIGVTDETLAKDSAAAGAKLIAQSKQSVMRAAAGHAAEATAVGIPSMIANQVLERAQAGQDVTSPEALAAYGHTAASAGLLMPALGAYGGVRGRSAAIDRVQAKTEADNAAAAKQAQQEQEAKRADPAYQQQVADSYTQLMAKQAMERKALGKQPDAKVDPGGALAWSERDKALKAELNDPAVQDLIREYAQVKPALDEKAAADRAQKEAYGLNDTPGNIPAQEAGETTAIETPAINAQIANSQRQQQAAVQRALQAAQAGDIAAAQQAQQEAAQHANIVAHLQKLATPVPVAPAAPPLQPLKKLYSAYTNALTKGDSEQASAILKQIQAAQQAEKSQQANAAEFGQRTEDMSNQTVMGTPENPMAGFEGTQRQNPYEAVPNAGDNPMADFSQQTADITREKQLPGEGAQKAAPPQAPDEWGNVRGTIPVSDRNRTTDTTQQKQEGLFGDAMEPGGENPDVGQSTRLSTEIEQLINHPQVSPATKAKLDGFLRTLARPELSDKALADPENTQAHELFSAISDSIRRLREQGEGMTTEHAITRRNVNERLGQITDELTSVAERMKATREAAAKDPTPEGRRAAEESMQVLKQRQRTLLGERDALNGAPGVAERLGNVTKRLASINTQMRAMEQRITALREEGDPEGHLPAVEQALGAMRRVHNNVAAERDALSSTGMQQTTILPTKRPTVATTLHPRTAAIKPEGQQTELENEAPAATADMNTSIEGEANEQQQANSKKWVKNNPPAYELTPQQIATMTPEQRQKAQLEGQTALNAAWNQLPLTQLGHPFLSGREVTHVNPEPATTPQWEQAPNGQYVPVMETVTTGKGKKQTTETRQAEGVAPADPNAEVNDWMETNVHTGSRNVRTEKTPLGTSEVEKTQRQLSPEDERTLSLWDPVFGEGSAANKMVHDAEAGLERASNVVNKANHELEQAQGVLAFHIKELETALSHDPANMQRKIVEGNILPAQREVETARAGVETEKLKREAAIRQAAADEAKTLPGKLRDKANFIQRARKSIEDAALAVKRSLFGVARATQEFNAEWERMQATGEISKDFVKFVGKRSLKEDLAKVTEELDGLIASYGGSAEGNTARLMVDGYLNNLVSKTKTAYSARALINEVVPQVTDMLGPKAGKLLDTVIRLQVARNIAGRGMELRQALIEAQRASHALQSDAVDTVEAQNKRIDSLEQQRSTILSATNSRLQKAGDTAGVEAAQFRLQEALNKLNTLQAALDNINPSNMGATRDATRLSIERVRTMRELEDVHNQLQALNVTSRGNLGGEKTGEAQPNSITMEQRNEQAAALQKRKEALTARANEIQTSLNDLAEQGVIARELPATKAARNAVVQAGTRVAESEGEVESAKQRRGQLVADANENLQRAQETRAMLRENEAALREGKPMPLETSIREVKADIQNVYDRTESRLQDIEKERKDNLREAQSDLSTEQAHLQGLHKTEADLTSLFRDHFDNFVDIQDRIQNAIDTNSLLSVGEYDPQGTDAQRMLARSNQRAYIDRNNLELVRAISQRERGMKHLQKLLDNNLYMQKNEHGQVQSEEHRANLQAQAERIRASITEHEQTWNQRINRLRETLSQALPDLNTSPDTRLEGVLREQISDLTLQRDKMRRQLEDISAKIDGVRNERKRALEGEDQFGNAQLKRLRELGLSDRATNAPIIRKQLLSLLEAQRVEEARGNKMVDDATHKLDLANLEMSQVDPDNRLALNAARKAVRAALHDVEQAIKKRSVIHDQNAELERRQLALAKELMDTAPPSEQHAKPAVVPLRPEVAADRQARVEKVRKTGKADNVSVMSGKRVGRSQPQELPPSAKGRVPGASPMDIMSEEVTARPGHIEAEKVDPLLQTIKTRVDKNVATVLRNKLGYEPLLAQLKKERGSLQSQSDTLTENYVASEGDNPLQRNETLTLDNAMRAQAQGRRARSKKRISVEDQLASLHDRITYLDTAIAKVEDARGTNTRNAEARIGTIAKTQTKGRTGMAMKRAVVAPDLETGSNQPIEGRNLGNGETTQPTTEATVRRLGTRNPIMEKAVHLSTTAEEAIAKAKADTAPGTELRIAADKAAKVRALEQAKTNMDDAQAKYDDLMDAFDTGERGAMRREAATKRLLATQKDVAAALAALDKAPKTETRTAKQDRAALEKQVEDARTAERNAQEQVDAATRARKIPESVKAERADALEKAKAAVKAADAALAAGTQTAAAKPMSEGNFESAANTRLAEGDKPLSDTAVEAAHDGRILDVVNDLAKNGSTQEVRDLAAKVAPLLLRTKLKVDAGVEKDGESVAGLYDPNTNTATMHPEGLTELNILHEGMHATTDRVLLADPTTLTPDQRAARSGLEQLQKQLANHPAFKGEHGATSARELAAAVMTEPAFRAKLDAIGKPESLLTRVTNFIKRLVGIKPATESDKARKLVERIMQPSRALQKGERAPSMFRQPAFSSLAAQFGQQIAPHPTVLEQAKEARSALGLALEQKVVDFRAALRRVSQIGNTLTGKQVQYSLLANDNATGNMQEVATNGAFALGKDKKGITVMRSGNSASAKDVFDAVSKLPGKSGAEKLAMAQGYLSALRARDKGWHTLNYDDPQGAERQGLAVIREVESNPALHAAMKEVQAKYRSLNEGLIKFLEQTHALPKEYTDEMLADKNYIPFYRDDGMLEMPDGKQVSVGDVRNMPFLHALNKGEAGLMPFEQSVFKNIALLTNMGMQNLTATHIAEHMQEIGKAGGKHNTMRIQNGDGPPTKDGRTIRFSVEPKFKSDDGKRHIIIDTKDTAAEYIPNDLLAQSVAGTYHSVPTFLKLGAYASDILRAGVTRMPMYVGRQLLKDPINAAMLGNIKSDPFTAVAKTMNGYMGRMTGHLTDADKVLAAHGVNHSNIFAGDAGDLSKIAMQIAGKNQSMYHRVLAGLDKMAQGADASTRAQGYRDVIAAGGSEAEAVIHAREMQNFNKRGSSLSVQMINRLIPFFNAQIQGLNVVAKAATGRMPADQLLKTKEAFFRRAMGMSAMALMYAASMEDDEDWKRLSLHSQMANIPVPGFTIGGVQAHIPAPYETGMLFWSLPVAFIHSLKQNFNDQDWQDVRNVLSNQLPGNGSLVPQIAKGALDVSRNYNSAFGTPIESAGMQTKDTTQRYTVNTPEAYKAFSRALVDSGVRLSPVQIDYLANAYLGQFPHMLATLTNHVFDTQQDNAAPTPTAHDNPVLAGYTRNPNESRYVTDAYEIAKKAALTDATVKSMLQEHRVEDAKAYRQQQYEQYGNPKAAKQFEALMGTLKQRETHIREDDTLSADAKRAQLDALNAARSLRAQKYLQQVREHAVQ